MEHDQAIQWYIEQCQDDDAHQSCTYHSFVNIDPLSCCSSSSYSNNSLKSDQTWALTRTMTHQNKRYQTAIENIRLAIPIDEQKTNKMKFDRSTSLLPTSFKQQPEALFVTNSMRFLHINGEIQVRI